MADNFKKIQQTAKLNDLLKIVDDLNKSGNETLVRAFSAPMTESAKQNYMLDIRAKAQAANSKVNEWIVKSIPTTYVGGMNRAVELSTSVPKSQGTTLFKWGGGEKGDIDKLINSTFGTPTVGQGAYFALDPNSSSQFGDTLKAFVLPKNVAKLYDATGGAKTTGDIIGSLAENPLYKKMLAAGESDFVAFAKKSGYSGVVFFSDDGKHKWVAIDSKIAQKHITETVPKQADKLTPEQVKAAPQLAPHVAAMNTLMSDAYLDFGATMTSYVRGAEKRLNDALKQQLRAQIAVGRVQGEGAATIKRGLTQTLKEEGFTVLLDRSGKQWELTRYTEMLARTHIIRANTEGTVNRASDFGVDIVEVSTHGATDSLCAPEEGQIYSVSGNSQNYPPLTGHEPPFHPNCAHTLMLRPELS